MEEINIQQTPEQLTAITAAQEQEALKNEQVDAVGKTPEELAAEEEAAKQQPLIDPNSPFAPFEDLRKDMLAKGVDFTEMDRKASVGEDLSDDEINLLAQHSGFPVQAVKAFIKSTSDNVRLGVKASAFDAKQEAEDAQALADAAGGDINELTQFIGKNAPPEQVKVWNAALKLAKQEEDRDLLLDTVKQMQSFRVTKQPPSKLQDEAKKQADLSLLTKAQNNSPSSSGQGNKASEVKAPTLDGNPLASASIQDLALIKLQGKAHPQYEQAIEAIKVRAPYMV